MKEFIGKIDIEKGNKAVKIQKQIDKLLSELDELGYEYMNHNNRSAIRRKRNEIK